MKSNIHRPRAIPVTIGLFCICFGSFFWYRTNAAPLKKLTANIPNAAIAGDVDSSIQQFHEIYNLLKINDWDSFKIPLKMKFLSDGKYAEDEKIRSGKRTSIIFSDKNLPEMEEIAFFTEIYVRANPEAYRGDLIKTSPEGFYLVAWKDGRITKVGVDDVRMVSFKNTGSFGVCFPGMKAYDPNGMKHPSIEFRDGDLRKASAQAKAFALKHTSPSACKVPDKK